jgi:hypothetical protein
MKRQTRTPYKRDSVEKSVCQYFHCRKRAKERLGIDLQRPLYDKMVSAIRESRFENADNEFKIKFIENQSKRLKLFSIEMKGTEPLNAVYDCFRKTIVTFLFKEENTKYIYHYIDVFGNKINLKSEVGCIWRLIKDNGEVDLVSNFHEFEKISNESWFCVDLNKIFDLKNGELEEAFN